MQSAQLRFASVNLQGKYCPRCVTSLQAQSAVLEPVERVQLGLWGRGTKGPGNSSVCRGKIIKW